MHIPYENTWRTGVRILPNVFSVNQLYGYPNPGFTVHTYLLTECMLDNDHCQVTGSRFLC